jgi:hypothetical protein
MSRLGITRADVIGIVHNHPAYEYSDYPELQRYPSGGDVPGGDWDAADWFVSGGAGGTGGSGFALYILDTGGHMREYQYDRKDYYKDLDQEQREAGVGLPDTMKDDGSSC